MRKRRCLAVITDESTGPDVTWYSRFIAYVAAGPRTRLNHLYSLYRRFRASPTQAMDLAQNTKRWRELPRTHIVNMAATCGLQSDRDVLLVSYFEDIIDDVENRTFCALPWRKHRWIPWRTIRSQKLSLSTRRKLSIHLNFSLPFVALNAVFLTLKCETLVLKTTAAWCDLQIEWQL